MRKIKEMLKMGRRRNEKELLSKMRRDNEENNWYRINVGGTDPFIPMWINKRWPKRKKISDGIVIEGFRDDLLSRLLGNNHLPRLILVKEEVILHYNQDSWDDPDYLAVYAPGKSLNELMEIVGKYREVINGYLLPEEEQIPENFRTKKERRFPEFCEWY